MHDEEQVEAHLGSGRFLAGASKGRWKFVEIQWPHVFIEVVAADSRRFTLRFECAGYPTVAPTGTLWDREAQQHLPAARWPRGGRVSMAFNHAWKAGAAIYLPCDREAIPGHDHWRSDLPHLIWYPARGLLQYIEAVCEILQSTELEHEAA